MRLESGFAQKQQQSQSLKLNMTQQLTQSIAMLQFATPELTSFLEEKALENPLIEVVPGTEPAADIPYKASSRNRADNNDWLEQIADNTQSLGDVLKEQLQMLKLPQSQRIIVLFLIESLDEAGYLTQDTDLIAAQLLMSEEAILAGLEILQNMEPAGIGARNMRECILLQIERSAKAPYIAYDLIQDYFMEFADKKWKKITAEMDVSLTEIQEVADFIQTLSPRPGMAFTQETVQYIVPELILEEKAGTLHLSLAKQFLPQIRFQESYYQTMEATKEKEVLRFLKEKTGEYDWIRKSLEQRESTLQLVGEAIVKHQQEFFLHQEASRLKPLTLREISEEIGVHESTVSRAVNGKYMETSQGVYELKRFFSAGLQQSSGQGDAEEVASSAIKQQLQKLIEEEDKSKPLSDQKIVDLLAEEAIQVSRRAIAKYRLELNIPSSSKRKRFDA